MSQERMTAYRAALGERFQPDAPLEALVLTRAEADKLLEALAEAAAVERAAASGSSAELGLRLGAGFGASVTARMAAEIGSGAGAEAVAARWAARGFGDAALAGVGPALLLSREAVIADPAPALIVAGRSTRGGWALAAGFVASALRSVAALAPAVEAGAARLVDPSAAGEAGDVPAPEPRARGERARQWAHVIASFGGGDLDALTARAERLLADYDAARRGGAAFDPMYGPAAAAAAQTYAQMLFTARMADPRLGAELEGASAEVARAAVAEALWAGPVEPEAAPRLDLEPCPIWRLDLGPAPEPARLPLAEAVALRLGEEALAAQREVAGRALAASIEAGPEGAPAGIRAEIEDAAAAVAAGAQAALAKGTAAEAFQTGWRVQVSIAPGCGAFASGAEKATPAAAGLAAVAEAWPELALVADLASAAPGGAPCGAAVRLIAP